MDILDILLDILLKPPQPFIGLFLPPDPPTPLVLGPSPPPVPPALLLRPLAAGFLRGLPPPEPPAPPVVFFPTFMPSIAPDPRFQRNLRPRRFWALGPAVRASSGSW